MMFITIRTNSAQYIAPRERGCRTMPNEPEPEPEPGHFAGLLRGEQQKCRTLSVVRFTSGRLGIVIARRAHYNQPLNHGGAPTLQNFDAWRYRIWSPNRGAQWYTQHAFEVEEDHEVLVDAIAAIRRSEVNPPDHGLLLVNNLSADVAAEGYWRLELVQMDQLFAHQRARWLAAWRDNEIPRADLLWYYSSNESSLASDSEPDEPVAAGSSNPGSRNLFAP